MEHSTQFNISAKRGEWLDERAEYNEKNRQYWLDCLTVAEVIEELRKLPQDAFFGVIDDGMERGIDKDAGFRVDDHGSFRTVTV